VAGHRALRWRDATASRYTGAAGRPTRAQRAEPAEL